MGLISPAEGSLCQENSFCAELFPDLSVWEQFTVENDRGFHLHPPHYLCRVLPLKSYDHQGFFFFKLLEHIENGREGYIGMEGYIGPREVML